VTFTTETGNQDFIVLFNEGEATIVGDEGCDLLTVLDQLDPDALANGRVGLFGLNTNFLEDDSLGMGSSSEGRFQW